MHGCTAGPMLGPSKSFHRTTDYMCYYKQTNVSGKTKSDQHIGSTTEEVKLTQLQTNLIV